MNDLMKLEEDVIGRIEELDIDMIQQPRSDFVLEHFVVGTHDMPGRQRVQAVLELQIKLFNIRRAQLEERKLRVEKKQKEYKLTGSTIDVLERELIQIEIERIEMDLAEMSLARLGAVREAQALLAILDRLPKYTYEQLQAEEAEYWRARLSRQALQDMKSMGTIGQGNAEAIRQMMKKVGTKGNALEDEALKGIAKLGE